MHESWETAVAEKYKKIVRNFFHLDRQKVQS